MLNELIRIEIILEKLKVVDEKMSTLIFSLNEEIKEENND